MAILTLFGHEKVKEGGGKKQKQYCRCGMENNLVFLSNWFTIRAQKTLFLIRSKFNPYLLQFCFETNSKPSLHLMERHKISACSCLFTKCWFVLNVQCLKYIESSISKSKWRNDFEFTCLQFEIGQFGRSRIPKYFDNFQYDWLELGHCILLVNHQINQEMQLI